MKYEAKTMKTDTEYFRKISKVIASMPEGDQEQARLWADGILDQGSTFTGADLNKDATTLEWDPASKISLSKLIETLTKEPPGRGPTRPKGPAPPPPKE